MRTHQPFSFAPRSMTVKTSFRSSPLRSEEHTSELQSRQYLVCRLLLEKKKNTSHLQSRQSPVLSLLINKQNQFIIVESSSRLFQLHLTHVASSTDHDDFTKEFPRDIHL